MRARARRHGLIAALLVGCAGPDEPALGLDQRPASDGCVAVDSPPERLAEHPCFESPALIPYGVNAPLWSDGADKQRFLAVPDGEVLHIGAYGRWQFPDGAVLVKEFARRGRRLETRFLTRRAGGYDAYTYVWNDEQTEAIRVRGGALVEGWPVPREDECFACHTDAAGTVLGLSTAQMNRAQHYPATGRTANQIDTLAGVGLLVVDSGESLDAESLPRMPDVAGTAPVAERARAYLHGNCAHCHQPGSGGAGTMDLRFEVPLELLGACDARPEHGTDDRDDGRLLRPGSAADSMITRRLRSDQASWRMPPLGSLAVDVDGADLVEVWIDGLEGCR